MKRIVLAAFGVVATLLCAASAPSSSRSAGTPPVAIGALTATQAARAKCIDSEGASTGFFCRPLSTRGQPIRACSQNRPRDLASCQSQTAQAYCRSRGFSRVALHTLDGPGNLAEVVCTRTPVAAVAPVEEWQPMFNVNLLGYDLREFRLSRRDDWKSCKAACDSDGQCQAWTVSQGASTCYLKWENNPELLTSNNCCITAIKGMASAGAASEQKKIRSPAELQRLGSRVQGAAEDEVGRGAEDAVRRGVGRLIGD